MWLRKRCGCFAHAAPPEVFCPACTSGGGSRAGPVLCSLLRVFHAVPDPWEAPPGIPGPTGSSTCDLSQPAHGGYPRAQRGLASIHQDKQQGVDPLLLTVMIKTKSRQQKSVPVHEKFPPKRLLPFFLVACSIKGAFLEMLADKDTIIQSATLTWGPEASFGSPSLPPPLPPLSSLCSIPLSFSSVFSCPSDLCLPSLFLYQKLGLPGAPGLAGALKTVMEGMPS